MRITRRATLIAGMAALAGCSARPTKFRSYDGPDVTRILVYKDSRRMYLMNGMNVLRFYDIDLGFSPVGDKRVEGDGKTPEGNYFIDRRNPDSTFHLSLGISYPTASDTLAAQELGSGPGGDIFIHGGPRLGIDRTGPDWTAGCIAVTNEEMEEIYAMVTTGTPISIYP